MDFSNPAAVLERIRTPLTLAGVAFIVLYGLYSQILDLGIFPELQQDDTAQLIGTMMGYVFWLALIAVVLGGLSFILARSTTPNSAPPPASPREKADR